MLEVTSTFVMTTTGLLLPRCPELTATLQVCSLWPTLIVLEVNPATDMTPRVRVPQLSFVVPAHSYGMS